MFRSSTRPASRFAAGGILLVCGLWLVASSGCSGRKRAPIARRSGANPPRSDVTVLGVGLAFGADSCGAGTAYGKSLDVLVTDTVWAYPVVRVALGNPPVDTYYLANTTRLSSLNGWEMADKIRIWSKLKNDIELEWYVARPTRSRFGRHERIRYRLIPLPAPASDIAAENWFRSITNRTGTIHLLVRARYGSQLVSSGSIGSETGIVQLPALSFRADTAGLGWATALVNSVPWRPGSTLDHTRNLVSCDSRSLVAYSLTRLGYGLDPTAGDRALDSSGRELFRGYVQFGRLYDTKGRRAGIQLGHDLKPGDIIHLLTLNSYAIALDDKSRTGYRYGGIPAGLSVLHAAQGYPRIKPLAAALWSLRTLFGKSWFRILRYEPILAPTTPAPKQRKPFAPAPSRKPARRNPGRLR